MILIDLIEALQKQIQFCRDKKKYKCCVYVEDTKKKKVVIEALEKMTSTDSDIKLKVNDYRAEAIFSNGNYLRIVLASDSARGIQVNGAVVDNEINPETIDRIIYPSIMPIISEEPDYNFRERVYYTPISWDDVEKLKEEELIRASASIISKDLSLYQYQKIILSMLLNEEKKHKREAKNMFGTTLKNMNGYDEAFMVKEVNNTKVLLYAAMGIPRDAITYETEFVNKTKQTYLNITGNGGIQDIDFETEIKVRLPINTNIYDGYEVFVNDGVVKVVLHEIKNEKPILKDYSHR